MSAQIRFRAVIPRFERAVQVLLATRILTLLAFTAHAVLGCCLSHGECTHPQTTSLVGHCCEHDEGAQESSEDVGSLHSSCIAGAHPSACSANSFDLDDSSQHQHSSGCDDLSCAYLGDVNAGAAVAGQHTPFASIVDALIEDWLRPAPGPTHAIAGLYLSTPAVCHRALLQVWLI